MKKAVIVAILLVLLGMGGVGGMIVLGMGPFAGLLKNYKLPGAKPPPEPPKDRVYNLGTYVIPVVSQHTIGRQLGLDMEIRVAGRSADKVGTELPRLKDAFLIALYDIVPRHPDPRSAADKQVIHQRLEKIAKTMFGDTAIQDVVIRSIYNR